MSQIASNSTPPAKALRVLSYNVHSCVGTDGKLSVERIAEVIDACAAHVVCLQELDVGRTRTGAVDQAQKIAELLKMEFHFHPALSFENEHYGDAILSRHPLKLMHAAALPGLSSRPHLETRGALWVSVDVQGIEVQIFNTHLGLAAKERLAQVEALCGSTWLGHVECRGPVIVCGDLNALPASSVYRKLRRRLRDIQRNFRGHWPKATFPSRFPLARIDHIFINELLDVTAVRVPKDPLVRIASDHLPLLVDLTFSNTMPTQIL